MFAAFSIGEEEVIDMNILDAVLSTILAQRGTKEVRTLVS